MKNINKCVSNKISNLNLFLSVFIVALHSSCREQLLYGGGYRLNFALQNLIKIIADSAVPMFFVMSGYLLFYKYDIRKYFDTLNRKVRTLLIPFVLWNLLGFAYHKCLSLLSIMTEVAEANPELLSTRNILYGVWRSAYDPPVWFIKTLFELILISPLVWGIASKLKRKTIVLVIFTGLLVIGFTPGYTSIFFGIPLYLLAATIACCENDMISQFSMARSYLCLILYCSIVAYLLLNNVDEKAIAYTFYRLISPVLLWNVIDMLKSVRNKRILAKYAIPFFLFCSHIFVIPIVKKMFLLILGNTNYGITVAYLCTVVTTIGLIWILSLVMKKVLPQTYKILAGGR